MQPTLRSIPRVSESHPLGSLPLFRRSRIEFQRQVMRQHPGIARVRLGIFEVLSVGAPELVHQVLVTHGDAFAKSQGLSLFARPLLGDGLLTSEGAKHRRQRRLLAPAFLQGQMAPYATVMAQRSKAALERILASRELDMTAECMRVALEIVAKSLFGAELSDRASEVGAMVTEAIECIMGAMTAHLPMPPFIPTPANLRLHAAVKRLDAVVYRMLDERRARGGAGDDVLSLLLAARDEDGQGMSDRQVRDEVMTLFLAGHETTAVALSWTLILLAQHPEIRARVEEEIDAEFDRAPQAVEGVPRLPLTLRVLKEAMRLYPPAYMLGRRALRAVDIGGYPVRKGQVVLINTYGIHHRADLYPEPERFDPDRFLPEREAARPRYAFLPFGAGARVCIGAQFALLEAQIVLATWLRRVRFDLVSPQQPIALEPLITLRPKAPVMMTVTER